MIKFFIPALLLAISLMPGRMSGNTYTIDESRFRKGIDLFFSYRLTESLAEFSRVESAYPSDPAPYFLNSVVYYYARLVHLQNVTDEVYPLPVIEKKFFENNDKAISLLTAMLAADPENNHLKLLYAASYGYRGLFKITQRNFMDAHSDGKKGYEMLRSIGKTDSSLNDRDLGYGLFDYISGSVPWYLRWLITSGSKEDGIRELEDVAHHSTYVFTRFFAMMFLDSFYYSEFSDTGEKRDADLRNAILKEFLRAYPDNFVVEIDLAGNYEELGQPDAAAEVYTGLIATAERSHNRRLRAFAAFSAGEVLLNQKKYETAIPIFTISYEASSFNDTYREKSGLKLARCYRESGDIPKAMALYNAIIDSSSQKPYREAAKEQKEKLSEKR